MERSSRQVCHRLYGMALAGALRMHQVLSAPNVTLDKTKDKLHKSFDWSAPVNATDTDHTAYQA